MQLTWVRHSVSICLAATLTACAGLTASDLFTSYTDRMYSYRTALANEDYGSAQASLDLPKEASINAPLQWAELARVQFLEDATSDSQDNFRQLHNRFAQDASKAQIQLSKGAAQAGSLVSNDAVMPYQMPLYEQVMSYHYQALNWLAQGNLESALVEIRRAELLQRDARDIYRQLMNQHAEELQGEGIAVQNGELDQYQSHLTAMSGNLDTGFANPYPYYLAGLLYEMAGEWDDAYIDYKRAWLLAPENDELLRRVTYLADKLDFKDDLTLYKGYQQPTPVQPRDASHGELVVLTESGLVPARRQEKFTFYARYNNRWQWYTVALPVYQSESRGWDPIQIQAAGQTGQTHGLMEFEQLAAKQLSSQYAGILIRQILRLYSKDQLRGVAEEEGGAGGNLLANLYNSLSDNADTRSWLSLPAQAQVWRETLPVGQHSMSYSLAGQLKQMDVEIRPGQITLVLLTGNTLQQQKIYPPVR